MSKLQRTGLGIALVTLLAAGLFILAGCSPQDAAEREAFENAGHASCRPFIGHRVLVEGALGWAFQLNGSEPDQLRFYPEAMQGSKYPFAIDVDCSRLTLAAPATVERAP